MEDYIAVGDYVEDENGENLLTVVAGYQEDLALMLNGENILKINVVIDPRNISFPVRVLSLDEGEVEVMGACMDMSWIIIGDGVAFKASLKLISKNFWRPTGRQKSIRNHSIITT